MDNGKKQGKQRHRKQRMKWKPGAKPKYSTNWKIGTMENGRLNGNKKP